MSDDAIRVEPTDKRVRVMFGGEVIADSTAVLMVWEVPYYPAYYLPRTDVVDDVLVETDRCVPSDGRGDAHLLDVMMGDAEAPDGAWHHPDSPVEAIRDHIRFDWDAMDAVFEEDEQIRVHPRSPYTRVDALPSSRHIQVEIDGVTVADSHHPVALLETGLPTRWYLPKTDVRFDLLSSSDTTSRCPYKGTAEYYDVTVNDATHNDIVSWYRAPLVEVAPVVGRVCFYNEKVDLIIDSEPIERPATKFS